MMQNCDNCLGDVPNTFPIYIYGNLLFLFFYRSISSCLTSDIQMKVV